MSANGPLPAFPTASRFPVMTRQGDKTNSESWGDSTAQSGCSPCRGPPGEATCVFRRRLPCCRTVGTSSQRKRSVLGTSPSVIGLPLTDGSHFQKQPRVNSSPPPPRSLSHWSHGHSLLHVSELHEGWDLAWLCVPLYSQHGASPGIQSVLNNCLPNELMGLLSISVMANL